MAKKASRADIASNLGLSLATVKKALGDYAGVGIETKARVLAEADRLGYKSGTRKLDVAVIIPCVPSYFWSELRAHLDHYINKEGLACRFFFFHDINMEQDALRCIESARDNDASVFICSLPDTRDIREKIDLIKNKKKIILIEEFLEIDSCYYIGENPYREGYLIAKRYLSLHKDKKNFLVFGSKIGEKEGRTEGFLSALKEEGIVPIIRQATININTKTRAAIWAREIKKHLGYIDCIFYSSGMINLFSEALAKLDGGRNIHIIGFDNDESASFENIMLAAIQNLQMQAEMAARTASEYISRGVFPKARCLFIKDKIIERN